MERKFLPAAIFFLVFASSVVRAAPGSSLTLDEAVDTALRENPTIAQLQASIQESERVLGQAKSARMPTLDNQLTLTRYLDEKLIPGTATSKFTETLNLSYSLYDAARQPSIDASRKHMEASRFELARYRRSLAHQVYRAFLQAFVAGNALEVETSSLEYYAQLKRDARVRYEEGLIPESDYLTFANAYDGARISKAGYRLQLDIALLALEGLMHRPVGETVELDMPDIPADIGQVDLDALYERALALRRDVLASRVRVEALGASADAARGSKKPSLQVGYTYRLEESSIKNIDHNKDIGLLTGQMNWRLSDGGARNHKIAQAEAQELGAEAKFEVFKWQVRSDIRSSFFQLRNAATRMEILAKTVSDAERNLDILTERYKEGLIIVTTVRDAEISLNRARHNLIKARADLAVDRNALELAIGGKLD